jgi:RNA polymerase sigma-70 factor (ECF subfamily)
VDAPAFDLPHDVRQLLAELKPRDQQLLWLAYVEGFSRREIAPLLGGQEESVRVLLLRARERMALLLKEQGLAPVDSA